MEKLKSYIKLLRPAQWVKNIFLFIPLFFDSRFHQLDLLLNTLLGAFSFSLVASGIYVLNDYFDRESDKQHPEKRKRPLASGAVSVRSAMVLMLLSALLGFGICVFLPLPFFFVLMGYLVLNVGYNFGLKHVSLVDVFILSLGYLLRVYGGGFIADIAPSAWLGTMTFFMALFLSLAKRRDDVLLFEESGKKMRKVIDGYNLPFLNVAMAIMASVILVSYTIYCVSPETVTRFQNENMYLSVIFVVLGLLRYLQITFLEQDSGSPTKVFYRDGFLQLTVLGWAVALYMLIYL